MVSGFQMFARNLIIQQDSQTLMRQVFIFIANYGNLVSLHTGGEQLKQLPFRCPYTSMTSCW